jgi:nucleotide sugar dehydrogenase
VYDISVLSRVLGEINATKSPGKHVVICCTVLPGYIERTGRFLLRNCPGATLSYNPEFICQGDVIRGLLRPDCVLIGEGSKEAGEILESMYKASTENDPRICRMSPESAEVMKISVNCFVTTKISYANMIGDICDRTPGADKFDVLKAVGADSRIGSKYIMPGYGYGGPCFPRDNRALGLYAKSVGIEPMICEATDRYNNYHAQVMTDALLEKNLEHYVITDVAYKRLCPVDIIEESQPLQVARNLVKKGRKVTIRDRQGIVALVQRHYGRLFLYEVADPSEAPEHGMITSDSKQPVDIQPLSAARTMGNPLSSYRS